MDDLMVILGFPVHPSFAGESIGESFSHWFHRERPWDFAEDSCERRRGREAKGARGRGSEAPQKYQVVLLHMAISIQHDHDKH